jgi:hypothetical protein
MIKAFLFWLTGKLPARAIMGDDGAPYLERYYLGSLLLAGEYIELRKDCTCSRLCAGSINVIRGDDFHRILITNRQPAWTLFIHGPRTKGWGFLRDGKYLAFSKDKDDYPGGGWWKTAPCGNVLREEPMKRELWLASFRDYLCRFGLSQPEAMVASYTEYGRTGTRADLDVSPLTCAKIFATRRRQTAKIAALERQLSEAQCSLLQRDTPCRCVVDGDDGELRLVCDWHLDYYEKRYKKLLEEPAEHAP